MEKGNIQIRLNHFLALAGVCSRRTADDHIAAGKVTVNGKIVTKLGTKIDGIKDTVTFNNKKITVSEPTVVYALNKPNGVTSTSKDKNAAKTIVQLVPKSPRVFSVGRLDRESEGLILLTNDGELANKLMHPSTHVDKVYKVICILPRDFNRNVIERKLNIVRKGVIIDGVKTQPCKITVIQFIGIKMIELEVTLNEGRKRQIRRSLGKIDLEVQVLRRIQIGGLTLGELHIPTGKWVQLTDDQIKKLYNQQ